MTDARHMSVILMKFTDAGAKDVQAALEAVNSIRTAIHDPFDIREESFLVTMGAYDLVLVCEVADADTAAFFALELARTGYVTTHTMCGFTPGDLAVMYPQGGRTRGYESPLG